MEKKDYKVYTEKTSEKNQIIVRVEGNTGIENVNNIRNELMNIDLDKDHVKIELKAVYKLDISFIQLLFSLKKHLLTMDKKIDIQMELRDDQKSMIKEAGMMEFLNNQ